MSYSDSLKHPNWQKRRLEILKRDDFTCRNCQSSDKTLNVHHIKYKGKPWEVESKYLITLCEDCHGQEHQFRDDQIQNIVDHLESNQYTWLDIERLYKMLIYVGKDELEDLKFCLAHPPTKDFLINTGKEAKEFYP